MNMVPWRRSKQLCVNQEEALKHAFWTIALIHLIVTSSQKLCR